MKSILLSIKPEYVELIASGEKTIEVRKTRPKLETPFKCYIYETIEKAKEIVKEYDSNFKLLRRKTTTKKWGGKVVGEFVCDKMLESFLNNNDGWFIEKGCLTQEEIDKYQGDNPILYGWHISNLKIYDKPKELDEFRVPCKFAYSSYEKGTCYEDCIQGKLEDCRNFCLPITRPFQSWGYIEYE